MLKVEAVPWFCMALMLFWPCSPWTEEAKRMRNLSLSILCSSEQQCRLLILNCHLEQLVSNYISTYVFFYLLELHFSFLMQNEMYFSLVVFVWCWVASTGCNNNGYPISHLSRVFLIAVDQEFVTWVVFGAFIIKICMKIQAIM